MELDPRLTFESFVVGPANRLAAAAARRAADAPGRSYNPLFLYSPSGLGKSHILSAIAHHSGKLHPDREVVYQPLEVYLGKLAQALGRGEGKALEVRYAAVQILLLDDVQFLTGQSEAQEMLLRTLDAITSGGGQVVLASDRPPSDIDGLDARLLSRFSGGLIVDMGQPDLETRVAILRRKAEERGATLAPGLAEGLARFPFRNVRELQGALNRVLAIQELEERTVQPGELPQILKAIPGGRKEGAEQPATAGVPEWRAELVRALEAAREEGFEVQRLERLLRGDVEPPDWQVVLRRFHAELARVREMRDELERLGNPWPEAAATLLRDPDRLEESEALLASARERARPFPEIPDGPDLGGLEGSVPPLALRAAERLLGADRPDYNPLYVHAADPGRARSFLEGVGRTYLAGHPEGRVGWISVPAFAEEFIRAIADGVAGAWRERWWTVEVLLLHGLESLEETERAQEEFFHLFEALKRRDARIFLAGDRPPSQIPGVDERLRSRFEGGLVVELEGPTPVSAPAPPPPPVGEDPAPAPPEPAPSSPEPAPPAPAPAPPAAAPPAVAAAPGEAGAGGEADDDLAALRELAGMGRGGPAPHGAERADETGAEGAWRPSPERVVWDWPDPSDRILEPS